MSEPSQSGSGVPNTSDPWVETLQIVLRRGLDLRERGDLDGAVECFQRCLDLSGSVSHRPLEGAAHGCLGVVALTRGNTDEARTHFEAALGIRTELGDILGQARSLNDLALCDLRAGHSDEALSRLRESLSKTSGEPPGKARAETLEHLGRVHRDRGDFKEALRMLKDALEARRELADEPGIAANLNSIGMVYHLMARPEEAFDHLRRAYELRRTFGDRRAVAVTANNLALVHYGQGHLEEAEALLGEAVAGFQAAGDRAGVAHGHSNLGLVFADQGRMEQAEEHHLESLKIRETLGDIPGQANSLNNLSHLAMERGHPLDALRFADRSLELRRESGLAGASAKPMYNRGRALLALSRMEEARAMAGEVVRIAKENGDAESEMDGRLLAAEIHVLEGHNGEASVEAQAALTAAEKTQDPRWIANALRIGAVTDAAMGKADQARDLLTRAERAMRGRPLSAELARIHREQGRLAATAGAAQAAVERLMRAAEEFGQIGNRSDQATTLALLARAQHGQSPEQAMKIWQEAERIAAEVEGWERPLDLGAVPGSDDQRPTETENPFTLIHDLLRNTAQAESPAQLGGWLARVRRAIGAQAVGLVSGRVESTDGDAVAHPLPDGRILWTPPGQETDPDLPALTAPPTGGEDAAARIFETIPGTDGSCWLAATGIGDVETAALLFPVLGLLLRLSRLQGVTPIGDTEHASETETWEGLVGSSTGMRALYRSIERVAASDVSVLVLGESGTGKELVARAVHKRSRRASGPFVPINCPSIPRELIEAELFGHERGAFTGATSSRPGKVELADGGTLFLDEVGDMDLATQSKLLRFLQEREFQRVGGRQTLRVDVRVLAATSRDLNEAMEAGTFRTDLYYRLNVVPISLPPLRERRGDVSRLVRFFLDEIGAATGRVITVTPRAMEILQSYTWPGNVRELRNTVANMAAMTESDTLDTTQIPSSIPKRVLSYRESETYAEPGTGHFPASLRPGETLQDRLLEVEASIIRSALEAEDWNQSAAARRLGVTETLVRNRIRKYSIQRPGGSKGSGGGGIR